jgi:hypothetical protein
MTDIEFNQVIEAATGKKIGVDYGFLFGTSAPYEMKGGMFSAHNQLGYTTWKSTETGAVEKSFPPASIEENLKAVINFLKEN